MLPCLGEGTLRTVSPRSVVAVIALAVLVTMAIVAILTIVAVCVLGLSLGFVNTAESVVYATEQAIKEIYWYSQNCDIYCNN